MKIIRARLSWLSSSSVIVPSLIQSRHSPRILAGCTALVCARGQAGREGVRGESLLFLFQGHSARSLAGPLSLSLSLSLQLRRQLPSFLPSFVRRRKILCPFCEIETSDRETRHGEYASCTGCYPTADLAPIRHTFVDISSFYKPKCCALGYSLLQLSPPMPMNLELGDWGPSLALSLPVSVPKSVVLVLENLQFNVAVGSLRSLYCTSQR